MDQGRRGLAGGMLGLFKRAGRALFVAGLRALMEDAVFVGIPLGCRLLLSASVVLWAPFDACPISPGWFVCAITPL